MLTVLFPHSGIDEDLAQSPHPRSRVTGKMSVVAELLRDLHGDVEAEEGHAQVVIVPDQHRPCHLEYLNEVEENLKVFIQWTLTSALFPSSSRTDTQGIEPCPSVIHLGRSRGHSNDPNGRTVVPVYWSRRTERQKK